MHEEIPLIGLLLSNKKDYQLLKDFLEEMHYQVIALSNLEIEYTQSLSMIITDEKWGRSYSRNLLQLKKELAPLLLPVVILINDPHHKIAWLRLGFNEVLLLPLVKIDLASKISLLLRLREESKNQYRIIFENINVGIYSLSLDHQVLQANPAFLNILGFENISEIKNKKLTDLGIFSNKEREYFLMTLKNTHKAMGLESIWHHKNGSKLHIRENAILYQDPSSYLYFYHGTIEDITKHKKLKEELLDTQGKLQQLIEHSPYGILIEVDEKIISLNKAMMDILHVAHPSQVIGTPFLKFVHSDYHDIVKQRSRLAKEKEEIGQNMQEKFLDINGNSLDVEVITCPFTYENKKAIQRIVNNISGKVKSNEAKYFTNYYDELTGLPNREKIEEALNHSISLAKKYNESIALFIINLDTFGMIYTSHMPQEKKILQEVALRLQRTVEYKDILGRMGPDQFIMIVNHVIDVQKEPKELIKKLQQSLSEPFSIHEDIIHLKANIGVSIYPFHGTDAHSLFINANIYAGSAKQVGMTRSSFSPTSLNKTIENKMSLSSKLKSSISNEEFVLKYQPKLCLNSGQVKGAEALLRWKHPTQGLIPPSQFIPLAEESGLIIPLTELALHLLCNQLNDWSSNNLPSFRVALNLSVLSLDESKLLSAIHSILTECHVENHLLEFELTESTLMEDIHKYLPTLKKFKEYGIQITLDDFGTGYSSLNYLKHIQFDTLKIDKSFIRDILYDPNDSAIVEAIILMARNLKLNIVAEGVENKDQLIYLKNQGCNEIQGYYFSKPLEANEVCTFLSTYPDNIDSILH